MKGTQEMFALAAVKECRGERAELPRPTPKRFIRMAFAMVERHRDYVEVRSSVTFRLRFDSYKGDITISKKA
jgi:hypothetical protein